MRPVREHTSRRRGRGAMTLVEMVVSLAIMAVILVACTSVMLLAARAIGSGGTADPVAQTASARTVADQVTADLKMALSVTEQTATSVTFTVPDRNGDSNPETIRYTWSGPGTSVTRQVNGQPVPAAPIAENVQSFDLQYLMRAAGPVAMEGAEQLLACHDSSGGGFKDFNMNSNNWCATYFKPGLPANAVSWKITRVRIMASQASSATETFALEIRSADANFGPTGPALQSVVVSEASLPATYNWTDVPLASGPSLDPTSGFCLVLRQISITGNAAKVQWEDGAPDAGNYRLTTSNSGSSWTAPNPNQHMRFYVYGTVTTQGL